VSCRTGGKGSALTNPGRLAITNAKGAICAASGDEKTGLANRVRGKTSETKHNFSRVCGFCRRIHLTERMLFAYLLSGAFLIARKRVCAACFDKTFRKVFRGLLRVFDNTLNATAQP